MSETPYGRTELRAGDEDGKVVDVELGPLCWAGELTIADFYPCPPPLGPPTSTEPFVYRRQTT